MTCFVVNVQRQRAGIVQIYSFETNVLTEDLLYKESLKQYSGLNIS